MSRKASYFEVCGTSAGNGLDSTAHCACVSKVLASTCPTRNRAISIPSKGVAIQVGTCHAVSSTGGIATSIRQGKELMSAIALVPRAS